VKRICYGRSVDAKSSHPITSLTDRGGGTCPSLLGFEEALMKRREPAKTPRKRPVQARSKDTVEFVVEAAARVFRREGFAATTNRIAREAGVSVGTLYEYFPNKQALLAELAERHVALAERQINDVLTRASSTQDLLRDLQAAIIASQRFPSQAIALITSATHVRRALQLRAETLRERVLAELTKRASGCTEPAVRARAAFAVVGELTARSLYELEPSEHAAFARHLLEMACMHMRT
jgi:AcrR family transcriptional regulator